MAIRQHFSFLFPIVTATVLVAIPAAVLVGAKYYSHEFNDPALEMRECVAAVEMAHEMLRNEARQRSELERQGLPIFVTAFNPILSGISEEGLRNARPRFAPKFLKGFILVPDAIDCTRAFEAGHVPIRREPPSYSDKPHRRQVMFSRIVFSSDGQYAYAARGSFCGGLCGSGWETVWHRHAGKWVLEKSTQTWIS
ncbi:MAG TPA: hypothetical protein VIM02_07515 [Rhizomicrobium sp.]